MGIVIMTSGIIIHKFFFLGAYVNIFTSLTIGTITLGNGLNRHSQIFFAGLVYGYIAYSYIIGVSPANIFRTYSHNHVSVVLLYATILFYLSCDSSDIKAKRYSLLPAVICFILCVFSQGRSGIISSAILLVSLLVLKYQKKIIKGNISTKILALLFLFSVAYGFYLTILYFADAGHLAQFEDRGLSSEGRGRVIHSFIENLGGFNLLLGQGANFAQETVGISAHNSYIAWHNRMGIAGILLMIYTISATFKYSLKGNFYVALLLPVLARSITDDILFSGGIMFGVLLVYILLKSESYK
jgi:hypothetical protein